MATEYGTLANFKSKVIDQELARPNLFYVEIGRHATVPTQLKLGLSCHAAQIPGLNIATTEKDIGLRSVAYQQIYSDIILSFYCDANMKTWRFWDDWCNAIVNPVNRRTRYYSDYAEQITIHQLNRQKQKIAEWKLIEAYPKQVDPISLDYSAGGSVMSVNVTITYRKFISKKSPPNSVDAETSRTKKIMNNTINKVGSAVAPSEDTSPAWQENNYNLKSTKRQNIMESNPVYIAPGNE